MEAHKSAHSADDAAGIINERWGLVQRVCTARLPLADVDDAVQDTFLQFLAADRRSIRNVDAWLVAVAVRVCNRIHRRRYRAGEVPFGSAHDVTEDLGLDDVLDSEWFEQLCQSLPERDRSVLHSLYVHPRARSDVAADLDVTTNHLRVIAYRARQRALAVIEALDLLGDGA